MGAGKKKRGWAMRLNRGERKKRGAGRGRGRGRKQRRSSDHSIPGDEKLLGNALDHLDCLTFYAYILENMYTNLLHKVFPTPPHVYSCTQRWAQDY